MPTPQEICEVKTAVAKLYNPGRFKSNCGFGVPNRLNPTVVFTGCPACKNESEKDIPLETIEDAMHQFCMTVYKCRRKEV